MREFIDEASYKAFFEQRIAEKDAEIKRLRAEIDRLNVENGISSVRDGLTFNSRTGFWSDKADRAYCGTCLNKDKRNRLKSELPWGWRCSAVPAHYYGNPDAPVTNAD